LRVIVVVWLKVPDVPPIVTVNVPLAAVLLAVNVAVLLEVAGFGLKDAVTPLGSPDADRVALPVKPFEGVIVTVLVPLVPCEIVTLVGDADRLKSGVGGAAFTVRLIDVVWVKPEVPVTVTVAVPVAAVLLAVNVRTLEEVAGFGLNDAVTPLGKPEAEKVTLPANPFEGVIVTVLVPLVPCVIVTLVGDADRLKSGVGAAFTLRLTVVVWTVVPLVPVIVIV
jgi:hypothetical protein